MGAGASVDEAHAKEHPAFSEEAWMAAGGSGGSLPLVRLLDEDDGGGEAGHGAA